MKYSISNINAKFEYSLIDIELVKQLINCSPNLSHDLPINCIMLAKYVPEDNQHIPSKEPKIKVGLDEKPPVQNDLIFSRVLSYSVLLDPTKYVKVRSSVLQEYCMTIIKFSINSEKGMALR